MKRLEDRYFKQSILNKRTNGKPHNITKTNHPMKLFKKNLMVSYVGYQPKPAVEVVLVAMKPITEKTIF